MSADNRTGCSREICVSVPVALTRPIIIRTLGRIIVTSQDVTVIISANVCARAGRFVGRIIPKTRAVFVVGVAAFRRLVVTVTLEEYAVLIIARVRGESRESIGIALSTDAVRDAIVPVVVAESVLVITSNIAAGIAGKDCRTVGVTLAVACPVHRAIWRDVVAIPIGVNSADIPTRFAAKQRTVGHKALSKPRHLGTVIVARLTMDVEEAIRNGFAH